MKPSGIEWIGDIPDDWEVRRLKAISKLQTGNTPSTNNKNNYAETGFPWLKPDNLCGTIKESQAKVFLSPAGKLETRILPANSILLCCIGSIGKIGFVSTECASNQQITALIIKHGFWRYFLYVLRIAEEELMSLSVGNVVFILNSERLGSLKIPFPPLKTQRKIADYLDEECREIDATIAKQKESIEKLKAYKQSLISETVTKGLDKSAPLKPSGIDYLGDIPSHWEIKKLKFVANFNQNTLPEDTDGQFELKYIDIGNVSSVDGIKEIQYFNFSNAPSRARRIVKYGDIIVSTVRTYLRAITSIKEDYDNCICSTGFAVITPKDNVQQDFVVYAIENESFIAQIIANSQGISYPAINVSQLENLKLAFPSIKEQKEIVDFLKIKLLEIDSTINKKQNIIQKLDAYKKSLIFECGTGKHKIY